MLSRGRWLWIKLTRRLWTRVALFAALAMLAALGAAFVPSGAGDFLAERVSPQVVDNVLSILASSMLGVTTFSLSIMVSAYASAGSSGTPRATSLVMEDATTRNVLAIFIGVFVYSLVGIIALSVGVYGAGGRATLFLVTLVVITTMIVALLRWIDHLASLGRLGETTARVERAAESALRDRAAHPYLGGAPWPPDASPPAGAHAVTANSVGYIQHVDVEALQQIAAARGGRVWLDVLPGDFVTARRPLLWIEGAKADDDAQLRDAIAVAADRSYDQDPRFGLIVMAEIASRALSPAVNDPGTAIVVIGRLVRLLSITASARAGSERDAPVCGAVLVRPLAVDDLFDDAFAPIARDGAALVEVQLRLQKALAALAGEDQTLSAPARRLSRYALDHARNGIALDADRARIERAAAWSA